MSTDIEHLHDVIEGRVHGRRSGKTFARCHELAGSLEVGESKTIICSISFLNDLLYLKPMIDEVLTEHGLEFEWEKQDVLLCNGKYVRFIPSYDYSEFIRKTIGLEAQIIPMSHWA